MSIIKLQPDIIGLQVRNENGWEWIDTDIDSVLSEMLTSKNYKQLREDTNAKFKSFSNYSQRFDYLQQNIPQVMWDGVATNGCITSYSQFALVELRNYFEGYGCTIPKDLKEFQEKKMNNFPFVYAAYTSIEEPSTLNLICKHDNKDLTKHRQLSDHLEYEIRNRLNCHGWVISHLRNTAYVNYEPDMIVNTECTPFHFIPMPDGIKKTKPLEKGQYDSLGFLPANSLEEIVTETRQTFEFANLRSLKAASRFFALRAQQSGFDGSDSYVAFVRGFFGDKGWEMNNIINEFTQVFQ